MNAAKSLSEWMADRGVGIDELVATTGLDSRVVAAIVAGRYTTSPQQRQKLADALRLSSDEIRWGQAVSVDHMYGHGPQFGRSP